MKRILDVLFRNFLYKLMAFVFAVLLWLLAAKKEIVSTEVVAYVKIAPPKDVYVVDYEPKNIKLYVEGLRREIAAFREEPEVILKLKDLTFYSDNFTDLKVKKDDIAIPVKTVRVISFSPKKLRIKVEKLIKKVVPVKLEAYGVKRGYKLILSPNYVTVLVPESRKDGVRFVKTEKVDISRIKGNAELYLNVESSYKLSPRRVKLIIRKKINLPDIE